MVTLVGLAAVQATEVASPIVHAAIRKIATDLEFFIGDLRDGFLLYTGRNPRASLFVEATGRILSDLPHGRQRAEPLGLDCKNGIELAPEVFQSDDRSELHQLFLGKMPLEPVEEAIGDPLVCVRHPFAKLQRQFFARRKERALAVISQRRFDFFLRRALLHPTGCVTVNSIWAAVDAGCFHTKEMSEVAADQPRR